MTDRSRSPERGDGGDRDRDRGDRDDGGGEGGGGREKGTALRWNDRGFGFIKPSDGGEDLFCHFSAITDGKCLKEGAEVEYVRAYDDRKQGYRASEVTGGAEEEDGGGGDYDGDGGGGGATKLTGEPAEDPIILGGRS